MTNKPIGIINSGLGGLSILETITSKLKKENIIYLADHQYCPYGDKSTKTINQRLILIINFLLSNIPIRIGILFLTSGNPKKVSRVATNLLNHSIIFDKCSI